MWPTSWSCQPAGCVTTQLYVASQNSPWPWKICFIGMPSVIHCKCLLTKNYKANYFLDFETPLQSDSDRLLRRQHFKFINFDKGWDLAKKVNVHRSKASDFISSTGCRYFRCKPKVQSRWNEYKRTHSHCGINSIVVSDCKLCKLCITDVCAEVQCK